MRHGETEWNVEGRWQGHADSPLTPRGHQQAQSLAESLRDEPLAAVFSSDLDRAAQTARYVADAHRLTVQRDARLREIDVGRWTGVLGRDLRGQWPEEVETWTERPGALRLPGGETLAEAQARALNFISDALPAYLGQTVLLVTHGTMSQTIAVEGLGGTVMDLWLKERIDNCQVSRLEWSPEAGLVMVELCDVRHLEVVGSLRTWRVADQQVQASGGKSGAT